jgi:GNAT superfamily N-acetyltransferase
MTALVGVCRVPAVCAPGTADLVADRLAGTDLGRWLVPDRQRRRVVLVGYVQILVDHALLHGLAQATNPGLRAVALWWPSSAPEPAEYEQRRAAACRNYLDRFIAFDDARGGHRPLGPHQRLAALAVHADWRGRGLGSALVARFHQQLDRDRTPAYTEAATARVRSLYLRHGYRDVPAAPFQLPDEGPMWWPMWRPPLDAPLR